MASIKKIFVILLATVSVAVGSLAVVPNAYAMENIQNLSITFTKDSVNLSINGVSSKTSEIGLLGRAYTNVELYHPDDDFIIKRNQTFEIILKTGGMYDLYIEQSLVIESGSDNFTGVVFSPDSESLFIGNISGNKLNKLDIVNNGSGIEVKLNGTVKSTSDNTRIRMLSNGKINHPDDTFSVIAGDVIEIKSTSSRGYIVYLNNIEIIEGDDVFSVESSTSNQDAYIFDYKGEVPSIDTDRPAIDGQENFVTSVEESKDIQYFIDFIKAIDDIDGDISHLIQIDTDNYTPNKRVLGKHEVKIYVEDTAGNRSDFTFYVNVVDITKPVITGNSDVVQIGYKETYNIENFRKTLKVTDNYDPLTNDDIKLKTDGYTSNKGKLGTWNVVFEAKDKSDNTTTFTKPIKVYDNIAPVFSGTKEVIKSYTKLMTLDEILKEVSVNDEIDGNITKITVDSDTFTGNGNKVGTYEIRLSAKDNAGNIGYWTITVKVIDDQGANWWITNGVTVNLTPGATLTRIQIVELLAKTGQVAANKDAVVTYDVDTYTENIGTPGLYTLGFTVKNLNGVSNSYTYGINVMDESNTDDENLDIEDDKSFIEKNLTWIIASGLVVVSIGGYLFIKKRK